MMDDLLRDDRLRMDMARLAGNLQAAAARPAVRRAVSVLRR